MISKFIGIIVSIICIIAFVLFAIANTQEISIYILDTDYVIDMPLYLFTFIISFISFFAGGLFAKGYGITKNLKIFWLKRKIKRIKKGK